MKKIIGLFLFVLVSTLSHAQIDYELSGLWEAENTAFTGNKSTGKSLLNFSSGRLYITETECCRASADYSTTSSGGVKTLELKDITQPVKLSANCGKKACDEITFTSVNYKVKEDVLILTVSGKRKTKRIVYQRKCTDRNRNPIYLPVSATDKRFYLNACAAHNAGASIIDTSYVKSNFNADDPLTWKINFYYAPGHGAGSDVSVPAKAIKVVALIDSTFLYEMDGELMRVYLYYSYTKCLSKGTAIQTPSGNTPVELLEIGDSIVSINQFGEEVSTVIEKVNKVKVAENHCMLLLKLKDGRTVKLTPEHPSALPFHRLEDLQLGDYYDGSEVVSMELTSYTEGFTYDLLPASSTGFYRANGILMGSTLVDPMISWGLSTGQE